MVRAVDLGMRDTDANIAALGAGASAMRCGCAAMTRFGPLPHSLSPDVLHGTLDEMSTGLAGVGMVMAATRDRELPYIVNDVDPSGSAYLDGRVRVGDALLELDGKSIAGLEMDQIIPLVRGKPGSTYVMCDVYDKC